MPELKTPFGEDVTLFEVEAPRVAPPPGRPVRDGAPARALRTDPADRGEEQVERERPRL
jgi:hypothetical protein